MIHRVNFSKRMWVMCCLSRWCDAEHMTILVINSEDICLLGIKQLYSVKLCLCMFYQTCRMILQNMCFAGVPGCHGENAETVGNNISFCVLVEIRVHL